MHGHMNVKNTNEFTTYRLADRAEPINILLLEFQVVCHAACVIFRMRMSRFTHMFTEYPSDFKLLLRERMFLNL